MYTILIANIKTILDTLTGTGQPLSIVYDYPTSDISGFPAVMFNPSSFENEFMSVSENKLGYSFDIFVICETKVAGKQTAFNTILANAVDKVIDKFRDEWNGGTTSDGHRIWYKIDSGIWGVDMIQDSECVIAQLKLTIKLASNVA